MDPIIREKSSVMHFAIYIPQVNVWYDGRININSDSEGHCLD